MSPLPLRAAARRVPSALKKALSSAVMAVGRTITLEARCTLISHIDLAVDIYAYVGNDPWNLTDPSGLRADVYVTPLPNGQQGYSFRAVDDQGGPAVTGAFNTTTSDSIALPRGAYTLTPRPHIEVKTGIAGYLQMLGSLLSGNATGDVNRHEGVPMISNTSDPSTIALPNGGQMRGVEIHPGRDPVTGEGGRSLGCLVCNNIDYGNLNALLKDNYNNGGAFPHLK